MKNGCRLAPSDAGVLPIGSFVESDLERGQDEEEEPDLGVGPRRRVIVRFRGRMGVAAMRRPYLIR